MANVPYINYKDLDEFYTIPQIAKLFDLPKQDLKQKCKQYGIEPRRNEIGDFGFVKYDVRKLHNAIYYEDRESGKEAHKEDDPWA